MARAVLHLTRSVAADRPYFPGQCPGRERGRRVVEEFRKAQVRRGLIPRSIDRQVDCLTTFRRWLAPDTALVAATSEQIEAFLDSRPIGPRTRYSYISHFHVFYEWCMKHGHRPDDPTLDIVRPRLRRLVPRPAPTTELARALSQGAPKHRAWILLAAFEGLRCQEIAGLRREDVLDTEGLLRITDGKGARERMVPLHPAVLAELVALPMPRSGWIFRRPDGGRYTGQRMSRHFNEFLASTGATFTAHQIRHWHATRIYASTHDLRLTQELLGHSSPATTAIYAAWDRGAAAEAVRGLVLPADRETA